MKVILTLVILALMLTSSATPVLMNPGFEEGWHLATTYWTLEGGPFHDQFTEITPPEHWTAWWIEGPLCAGTPDYRQGRPEVRVIGVVPDPTRVRSGEQVTKFFTFWWCHQGGLYQQVTVEVGKYYSFHAFAHSWFANCDRRPHYDGLPLNYDCVTPVKGAHNRLRVGIDSTGAIDPRASTVEWGMPQEIYGGYGPALTIDRVEAVSTTITLFFESVANLPLKHDDVYLDDFSLWDSTYVTYLPFVWQQGEVK